MKKIFGLLFNRWTMAIAGLIAISLVIWFAGPLIAFADYRPLESATTRWIVIAIVILSYIGKIVWRMLKAKSTNAKLFDGLLKQAPAQPQPETPGAEEVATLRDRFNDAMGVLKQGNLGRKDKTSGRTSLLRRQYVYQLPWYMFIGAPGSGKTTALINSGLKFPLAKQFGQQAIKGIGGTRNCDWWFTDEAVLLDTAGRYTTQESNQEVDSAAWNGFLALLKKFRPRRPINGVFLIISVADLLQQSSMQRDSHAQALRKRIQELHEQLGIRFPVYVLITKADLLAGFAEFFNNLGAEERAQVWGVSFPFSGNMTETPVLPNFANEFSALEQRLNDRLIGRLQEERNPQLRALIYAFPQQFSSIRGVLDDFLNKVFAPSRFEEKPLLRGIYFTSGTQEGNAIDRVMGTLGRAFRLENKLLAPQQASGKSFFITRLLSRVIFPEAGLAGTNLRWERRRALLQWSGLIMAILITIGSISAWAISYSRNKSYVVAVQSKIPAVVKQTGELSASGDSDVVRLLPILEAVKNLPYTSNVSSDSVPLSMGFGLYQGEKLTGAANSAYRRLLQDVFLPKLSLRIEEQLRSRSNDNAESLYETLKAYLMLHNVEHFDADALQGYIEFDWDQNLPRDVTTEQRAMLGQHLATLLTHGAVASPIAADARLIAEVRASLARMPLAERIYSRLKRLGIGKDIPEFTIAGVAGPSAALVFTQASGQPLTKGVAGMFSYKGYYNAFLKESDRVATQLANEEEWVLGLPGQGRGKLVDLRARDALTTEVRRIYLTEYANTWQAFIDDIRLIRGGGIAQTIQQARVLAAPDSPLRQLLLGIVKEVTLVRIDNADKDLVRKGRDIVSRAKDEVGRLVSGQESATLPTSASMLRPETIVDDRFAGLRQYVRAPAAGQPAPIDATLAIINELYGQLTATELAVKGGNPPPQSDLPIKAKAEAGRLPEPAKSLLSSLAVAGQSQGLAAMRTNLAQALKASISDFCVKAITGRYPFVKSSQRNVTQEDFARLFAPGGLLDDFFQKNLVPLVDTSARPWRFREMGDASIGSGSAALLQFQRAQTIRDIFFRSGAAAGLRLDFKPVEMDASITQFIIDVDGQIVKYGHGPQVPQPVQWPGPRGSTQVRIQISPPTGRGGLGPFEGPWALFRMFDQVKIDQTVQPERFLATFNIDGRKAQFEITASSVLNPFRLRELEQFQCPGIL